MGSGNGRSGKRIFLSPPHMAGTELDLIHEVFASNYVAPTGPMLDRFEREFADYVGQAHAVAVASGTAAIHLALRALGVGPGDEVWASTLTFMGSVSSVVHLGAVPVFFDADPTTWTIDVGLLEGELARAARLGKLPKVVLPTELYGQCCDLDAILEVCNRHGVHILLDAAESVGATYKGRGPGVGAAAAAFSFNGNKIMTTSGGGMLTSDSKDLVAYARFLSQQAREPAPHYQHETIGYNYRLSNVLAAIGVAQLGVIEERVRQRRAIFDRYQTTLGNLPGISFMPEADYGRCTRWLTVCTVDPARFGADREQIRLALEAENIEARPVWKPMHMQPVFADARVIGGGVSETFFRDGLCLPSGSQLSVEEIDRISGIVRGCGR